MFMPPFVTEFPAQFPFELLDRIELVTVTLPLAALLSMPPSLLPDMVLLVMLSVPLLSNMAPPPLAELLPEKVLLLIVAPPLL